MKIKINLVTLLFSIIILASCGKSQHPALTDYMGFWAGGDTCGVEHYGFERVDVMPSDRYGFEIRSDGTLIENKNSGWCGTPPITYDRFNGVWEAVEEDLLSVKSDYWGGQLEMDWTIIHVDADSLVLDIKYL